VVSGVLRFDFILKYGRILFFFDAIDVTV